MSPKLVGILERREGLNVGFPGLRFHGQMSWLVGLRQWWGAVGVEFWLQPGELVGLGGWEVQEVRCSCIPCYARSHGVILGKSLHFWASSFPNICQEGQGAAS